MTQVLVTHASEHGATAQIAQAIARNLRQFDLDVTARRISEITDIHEFDVVILGSAIYLGEWLPKAESFLKENLTFLKTVPVWLFASGPTGEGAADELLQSDVVPENIAELIDEIKPRDVKIFKGRLDLRRLSREERRLVKSASVPRGDYRNWQEIKTWSLEVGQALTVSTLAPAQEVAIKTLDG